MLKSTYWPYCAGKTPSVARLLLVFFLFVPAQVGAQTWDEEAFVKHGLGLLGQERGLLAEQSLIEADVGQETAHPLPRLELEYEPMWSDGTRRDELKVGMKHTLDLTGWRSQLRSAAQIRQEGTALRSRAFELETANAIRVAFWRVRFHEERLQIYVDVQARFLEALRIIEARANAGDASGLDVLRIQRQLQLVRAEALAETLQLEEAWSRLDEWRAEGARPEIDGQLIPPNPTFSVQENPALRYLNLEHEALAHEARAWGRPGFRDWELGAGYRLERDQDVGHGALVSLTIPLALWNVDDSKLAAIHARKEVVTVQKERLEKRLARAMESTQLRLSKAISALDFMPNRELDGQLSQLITKAFSADEASLFDLIEAIRSDVELGLARTDLEWEARRAFLELQFLTAWEQPQ